VAITDKVWNVYIGQSWIGTLTPTSADNQWYYADFTPGDAWGNFAPWFLQAVQAHKSGDEDGWKSIYQQITLMNLTIAADDGESYTNPSLHIDGAHAWFIV
jgi:hypothetical protein